jgi:hypothetical protein
MSDSEGPGDIYKSESALSKLTHFRRQKPVRVSRIQDIVAVGPGPGASSHVTVAVLLSRPDSRRKVLGNALSLSRSRWSGHRHRDGGVGQRGRGASACTHGLTRISAARSRWLGVAGATGGSRISSADRGKRSQVEGSDRRWMGSIAGGGKRLLVEESDRW